MDHLFTVDPFLRVDIATRKSITASTNVFRWHTLEILTPQVMTAFK